MKRGILILLTLSALFVDLSAQSADAGGFGRGGGRGFGRGLAAGILLDDNDSDFTDLYRELLKNVPYYALHPPVYYSYPVPRPYGYSPFAYPPSVRTPEILGFTEPEVIINPHVPSSYQQSTELKDQVTHRAQPQPLVIFNPYVEQNSRLASAAR
jgi:hypothetical protein